MNNKLNQKDCMVAFIFDSGKFTTVFYGDKGVELILKEPGLKRNQSKIVVSLGDIFKQEMCVDISPFVIRDELCSIKWEPVISSDRDFDSEGIFNVHRGLKDFPFVVLMEDIEVDLVKKIDKRLHKDCKAYLGVTSIDVESKDQRKQFWKDLIRSFSLEDEICTVFGEDEANYMYEETIKEAGYQVHYDGLPNDLEEANRANLFSTRQSSYIQKIAQLKYIKESNDSDRGLLKMNSALVKEVEIAGVEIWKAVEDINKVYLTKDCKYTIVDYIFTSLYQAAQGTERLLKIIVELIVYINKNDEEIENPFWNGEKKYFTGKEKEEMELQAIFKEAASYVPRFATFGTTWAKAYDVEWLRKQNIIYEPELRRGQDTVFNLHAFETAEKVLYVKRFLYHYRMNSGSTVNKYTEGTIDILERISRYILKFIKEHGKDERFYQAYNNKSIQLLSQSINSDYAHKNNPKNYLTRRKELKTVLRRKCYRDKI